MTGTELHERITALAAAGRGHDAVCFDIVTELLARHPQTHAAIAGAVAALETKALPGPERVDLLDSEGWTCRACGVEYIGRRPADDVCPACVVQSLTVELEWGAP